MTKAEVARRQLGTALALYLKDRDPVSVHCLACGGAEIAGRLAAEAGGPPLEHLTLQAWPAMSSADLKRIRNGFWNAFKHVTKQNGRERDDSRLLADFSDTENDSRIFEGWLDYGTAGHALPIEAQVFVGWYIALNMPKSASPDATEFMSHLKLEFPGLDQLPRDRQKRRLRDSIAKWKKDRELMNDSRTDRRPLILI